MAHHKRGRVKSQRAGCACKSYKFEQFKDTLAAQPISERRYLLGTCADERSGEAVGSRPATKRRKVFVIECRWLRSLVYCPPGRGDWHSYRRYKNEAARDRALKALVAREPRRMGGPLMEFRLRVVPQ